MAKLIMCKGLPGSGKSTWAQDQVLSSQMSSDDVSQWFVRVNKDDIRAELEISGWTWSRKNERDVIAIRDEDITDHLEMGFTVISDDTNLAPKHEARLRELAKQAGAEFEIQDFTSVPIEVCTARDAQRPKPVGEKVIRDMAEEHLRVAELVPRTGSRQLFLDLDGVLADFDGFIEKELGIENNRDNERPDFWDNLRAYRGRLYYDMPPLPGAKDLFQALASYKPIILTGCPWSLPSAASDKRQWVAEHIDPDVHVITCRSRSKWRYGLRGDILVDDWTKYQGLWEEMGGTFVHHTSNDKTVAEVRKLYEG